MNPSRLMTPSRQDRLGLASVVASLFVMAWLGGAADAALLVQYTFDEPSGNAVNSGTLGSVADGLFANGAIRTSNTPGGISAGALDTSASGTVNSYSVLQTATPVTDLTGLSAFTVTTWLNLQGDIANNSGFTSFVSTQGNDGGFALAALNAPATAFFPRFGINMSAVNADVAANASGSWLFLAVTYNGANATFYTGGVASLVSQLGSSQAAAWGTVSASGRPLLVGNYTSPYDTSATPGYLDDVRIYDTALNATALNAIRLENLVAVPEPSTFLLIGCGGLMLRRQSRRPRK